MSEPKGSSYLLGLDLVDQVHDAINATDPNGILIAWNVAAERLYGYSASDILGKNVSILFFPEDLPMLEREIFEPLKTKDFLELTVRNRCKDGSEVFVALRLSVVRDGSGAVVSMIGCSNDITQRKYTEQALRDSDEKLKELLMRGPAVLWVSRPSGNYAATFVSENVTTVFGYSPEDFLGDSSFWLGRVHPDDVAPLVSKIEERIATGRWFSEYRFLHRDGTYRHIRDSAVAVKDAAGNVVELVGHMVDVTAEKQAESDRQEREKLRLFADAVLTAQEAERKRVSRELHDDLNQRLASLILDLSLLHRNPPKSAELLRPSLRALKHQVAGISDDVRRIALQLHSAGLEQFGLCAAFEQECAALAERTKIQIRFQCESKPDDLPENVSICLYRVAQECLRNVVKHSKAKRVTVTLEGTPEEVRLSVEDKGVGFDVTEARIRPSLGLISMDERIRHAGGSLLIDSVRGRGTRIEARVPLLR